MKLKIKLKKSTGLKINGFKNREEGATAAQMVVSGESGQKQ